MTQSPTFTVFISFHHIDALVALCLKERLEKLLQTVEVFCAADVAESVRLGEQWMLRIVQAISASNIAILLASPDALRSPFVSFEFGALWFREQGNKHVRSECRIIPVCIYGQRPSDLPRPFSDRQALKLDSHSSVRDLYKAIGDAMVQFYKGSGSWDTQAVDWEEEWTLIDESLKDAQRELSNQRLVSRQNVSQIMKLTPPNRRLVEYFGEDTLYEHFHIVGDCVETSRYAGQVERPNLIGFETWRIQGTRKPSLAGVVVTPGECKLEDLDPTDQSLIAPFIDNEAPSYTKLSLVSIKRSLSENPAATIEAQRVQYRLARAFEAAAESLLENDMTEARKRWSYDLLFNREYRKYPSILCCHGIVITNDHHVIAMKRSPDVSFYPNAWSFSYEEQIWFDQDLDPQLRTCWMDVAQRGIREELGLQGVAVESYFLSAFHEFSICGNAACVLSLIDCSREEVQARLHVARLDWEAERLQFIPMNPATLASVLLEDSWETHKFVPIHPTSKYRLMTTGIAIFGAEEMLKTLGLARKR
jgi:hypothetical protein